MGEGKAMNDKILMKITGLVLIILGIAELFNFFWLLSETINLNPSFFLILKLVLELLSGTAVLYAGIELQKNNKKGQMFLIIGTVFMLIKSVVYFEIRNYILLILLILVCIFQFYSYFKKNKS